MLITCLEDPKESLFNHSNCSHSSLEVAVYLFLSLKGRQSFIVWCVLCRFHWLYHCCHSLSLIAICFHSLSLVVLLVTTLYHLLLHSLSPVVIGCDLLSYTVTRCTTRCHALLLIVTRYHSLYHSLSLDVPLVCLFVNDNFSLKLCLMVYLISKLISWSDIAFDMNTAMVTFKYSNLNIQLSLTWTLQWSL